MFYFTGKRQPGQAWILPAKGEPVWISTEATEAADALRAAGAVTGRVGLEEQVRFATFDGLRKAAPAVECVSATPVTAGCRMIKSAAEIALLQRANDLTIAAYKAVLGSLREGMTQRDLSAWISAAYRALGVGGAAMASFGKFTAFPHGSIEPQQLREGDIVLIDGVRQADEAPNRSLESGAQGARRGIGGGQSGRAVRERRRGGAQGDYRRGFRSRVQGAGPAASHGPRNRPRRA